MALLGWLVSKFTAEKKNGRMLTAHSIQFYISRLCFCKNSLCIWLLNERQWETMKMMQLLQNPDHSGEKSCPGEPLGREGCRHRKQWRSLAGNTVCRQFQNTKWVQRMHRQELHKVWQRNIFLRWIFKKLE